MVGVKRWSLVVIVVLLVAFVMGSALMEARDAVRAAGDGDKDAAPTPLPTPTATASPTAGWWEPVALTMTHGVTATGTITTTPGTAVPGP